MKIYSVFDSFVSLFKEIKYKYYSAEKICNESRRVWLDKYYIGTNANKVIPQKDQTIILMVDGHYIHGGLTDRLRGIVATYLWATQNGYTFKINWCHPYRLDSFLKIKNIDWRIEPCDVIYNYEISTPICIYDYKMPNQDKIFDRLMRKFVDGKHKQYHVYSNIDSFESSYGRVLNELFTPSDDIINEVNKHVNQLGDNFVSITLRFQELLGDFKEKGEWKTLSSNEQQLLITKCINKIRDIYNNDNIKGKILVTSDSSSFLEAVSKALPFVYIIPGKISHVDCQKEGNAYEEHLKSFIDVFVLSKASKSYLIVTDDMYKSNFAKYASLLGNHDYEEIIF